MNRCKGWLMGCEYHGNPDEVLKRMFGAVNWPAVDKVEVKVIGSEEEHNGYIEPEDNNPSEREGDD